MTTNIEQGIVLGQPPTPTMETCSAAIAAQGEVGQLRLQKIRSWAGKVTPEVEAKLTRAAGSMEDLFRQESQRAADYYKVYNDLSPEANTDDAEVEDARAKAGDSMAVLDCLATVGMMGFRGANVAGAVLAIVTADDQAEGRLSEDEANAAETAIRQLDETATTFVNLRRNKPRSLSEAHGRQQRSFPRFETPPGAKL